MNRSQTKPIRALLGRMSSSWRLGQYLSQRHQRPQAQGMKSRAKLFWKMAQQLAQQSPSALEFLTSDELDALENGTPLPLKKKTLPSRPVPMIPLSLPPRPLPQLVRDCHDCEAKARQLQGDLQACTQQTEQLRAAQEEFEAELESRQERIDSLNQHWSEVLEAAENVKRQLDECQADQTELDQLKGQYRQLQVTANELKQQVEQHVDQRSIIEDTQARFEAYRQEQAQKWQEKLLAWNRLEAEWNQERNELSQQNNELKTAVDRLERQRQPLPLENTVAELTRRLMLAQNVNDMAQNALNQTLRDLFPGDSEQANEQRQTYLLNLQRAFLGDD